MADFLFATDLHGNRRAYEELFALEAEAIVLGGDLLPHPFHAGGELLPIQRRFAVEVLAEKFRSRPTYWLLGNDDWAAVLPLLEGAGTYLHGRARPFLDGLTIVGYSCVPVTPFGMKDFDRYDSADWEPSMAPRKCLESGPEGIRTFPFSGLRSRGTIAEDLERLAGLSDPARTVYVMHSPPWNTLLDVLYDGTPIGSRAVRAFIERRQPPLTLHGHIHESPGVDRLGRTVSVNPGASVERLRAVRVRLPGFEVIPLP